MAAVLTPEIATGRTSTVPEPTGLRSLRQWRQWPAVTWVEWLLRAGVALEFLGHGSFGIIGKVGWLPYFNIFGISDSRALDLMPVIGTIDIAIALLVLFRPMRAVLVYAAFWSVMTAVLRPLAGQGVWEEVLERGGNWGLPLALLLVFGLGRPASVRSWFEHARPRPFSPELARQLAWLLRLSIAALLVGHGTFGLSHLHDQEWTKYFGVLGIGPDTIISANLMDVVAWFEIALGVAVLVKPFRGLVALVLTWKLGTESLRVFSHEPVGELVERAGDFFLPAALLLVQGWLVAHAPAVDRRERLDAMNQAPARVAVATVTVIAALGSMLAFRGDARVVETRDVALTAEPTAGQWRTWVASPDAIKVPPPPSPGSAVARSDKAILERLSIQRNAAVRENVSRWNGVVPSQPWTDLAFEFVSKSAKNPPLSSRNYALLHVAMYDAVVTAWKWKYDYNVAPPSGVSQMVSPGADPSYPSEHAAIAGAASRVLAHLYPEQAGGRLEEMADQAGLSRVQAGVNTPSDVAAGLDLGRRVADSVIAYADSDGSNRVWDGNRPPGIGRGPQFWEPAPGVVSPPTSPLAGTWKPWVMTSGSQFRPPPPPAFGSPEFVEAAREIVDISKHLTPEQQRIAKFYEGAEGTSLPAGIIVDVSADDVLGASSSDIASNRLTVPKALRALTLLNVGLSDAGVATWDAKFAYWNPRPENGIRDLGLDPEWKPLLPTPRFPAYPSGSAGYAGAAEAVLSYLFPDQAAEFHKRAVDQAESRLFAGIHWRYDSVGLEMGRKIGALVVDWARHDGR